MTAEAQSPRDQGLELLRQGLAEQSIDAFLQAIEDDPSDPQIYLYLGLAYYKVGDTEKMIEILEKAADIAPTSPQVHYNLGVAYQKSHNATLAKDQYLLALGFDPNYAVAKQALDSLMAASSDGQTMQDGGEES